MKETFLMAIIVIFCMLVIPLSSLKNQSGDSLPTANIQSGVTYESNANDISLQKIKVLKDGDVIEYTVNDYIFGVVAAEMPALYEEEALKAQTVAAYTFACYKKETDKNQDYDISAEAETAQCFITRQEAATRWGEKAQEYTSKLDSCISSVLGETLTYENKIIFAAYHAISPGVTNSCLDVWGKDLPYLQSVNSSDDCLADNYLTEVTFTTDEIAEKLKSFNDAAGEPQDYFTDLNKSNNGYVKTLKYCGKEITGSEIRSALNLRSCNFEITFSDNLFKFTVKGYGHGVGMSQTGANAMAKKGYNYQEILLYYYPQTKLQKNQKNT